MVVNHNMAAICESRQLRYNVKKMEKSSKKLATGYKLNTANDDAAGLQISETMRHHVKGLNKASGIHRMASVCCRRRMQRFRRHRTSWIVWWS